MPAYFQIGILFGISPLYDGFNSLQQQRQLKYPSIIAKFLALHNKLVSLKAMLCRFFIDHVL